MKKTDSGPCLDPTTRNYTFRFKLRVVREIEQGIYTAGEAVDHYGIRAEATVCRWLHKYGAFNREPHVGQPAGKPPPAGPL